MAKGAQKVGAPIARRNVQRREMLALAARRRRRAAAGGADGGAGLRGR